MAFTFSNGPIKALALKQKIKEVIEECQKIGLKTINRTAIKSLLKDGYLINNEEVVALYDVPHLFKGIRNNLLNKNLYFIQNGQRKIAKWSHIEQFHYLDLKEVTRICHRLTDQHVLRHRINKIKVQNCTQVLKYKVGSLMGRIARWGMYLICIRYIMN